MKTMSLDEIEDIIEQMSDALAMTQCAEDATDEESTRRVLALANGCLIGAKKTLEFWTKMPESKKAIA